ncbi:MAG TPA: shikimate kinase [Dehalococcoidia bacterium]|jgi:shikimate kinase|nr:shikimate kinase [Dehalococcoidia bacterium]
MKTNLALIGFMGAGKTAVGKVLAERLGKEFIELDALIEQRAGKTIPEIFQQDGEIAFRELEIEAVKEVCGKKNAVIACGGGVVLNQINIDRLRKESLIVYLKALPGVILKRTSSDANERPLLKAADRAAEIRRLVQFRKPFYERAADITIDTSKLDVDSVAEQIIKRVKEKETA